MIEDDEIWYDEGLYPVALIKLKYAIYFLANISPYICYWFHTSIDILNRSCCRRPILCMCVVKSFILDILIWLE